MISAISTELLVVVVVFCRVGAFVMIVPGLSGHRVPMQLRIFLALAGSVAVATLVGASIRPRVAAPADSELLILMLQETAVGIAAGFMIRIFFLALHFCAMLVSNLIGLTVPPQPAVLDSEQSTPLADIVMLATLVAAMQAGLHFEFIAAILDSYVTMPSPGPPLIDALTERLATSASAAFQMAVQLAAPFVIYALCANALLAAANRWVPQIPVQFMAGPALLAGGLLVIYSVGPIMIDRFLMSIDRWLSRL
jgi:flagellar biosynthesis protein FliR